ncbi:MAG TPA: MFS transporter [Chthoniobacterales bacterium]|jgi:ACS family tartrate transporter-like MFS transporter|nr:MFS transporter [Chthoniobacterales bacterium]
MLGPVMPTPPPEAAPHAPTRIAWRLLPFLFLLYVTNYLDRTNIAYATLGMKGDLGLTDSVFGTASGVFFIGYFLLQIPGALLVEWWSARRLLALTLVAWGGFTALTGFVRTPVELYGARFLLGAAEAAFFPGVIVYLSHWFVYRDRAKAMARFMTAIPIGFVLGGPLAAVVLKVDWWGVPGWRWLFLLEGIPAVLLGIATLFYLPDRPEQARWLPPDDRDWINHRLAAERAALAAPGRIGIWQALRQPAVLLLTAGLFFTYSGGYAFWFWEPTMLQRLTEWTVSRVAWFGAVIFGFALLAMLFVGWSSDRTGERRWHFAIPQLAAALALAGWLVVPQSDGLLIVLFSLVAAGTCAYLPAFWTLPSAFLSSAAAAAAIGFINCVASIGGFFGPKIVGHLSQRTGSFSSAFLFMIACWTLASFLVLLCPRIKPDTTGSRPEL